MAGRLSQDQTGGQPASFMTIFMTRMQDSMHNSVPQHDFSSGRSSEKTIPRRRRRAKSYDHMGLIWMSSMSPFHGGRRVPIRQTPVRCFRSQVAEFGASERRRIARLELGMVYAPIAVASLHKMCARSDVVL